MADNTQTQYTPPPEESVIISDTNVLRAASNLLACLEEVQIYQEMEIPDIIDRKDEDIGRYGRRIEELKKKSKKLQEDLDYLRELLTQARLLSPLSDVFVVRSISVESYERMVKRAKMNLDIAIEVLKSGTSEDLEELARIWRRSEGPRIEDGFKLGLELADRGSKQRSRVRMRLPERFKSRFKQLHREIGERSGRLKGIGIVREKFSRLATRSKDTASRLRNKASRKPDQASPNNH